MTKNYKTPTIEELISAGVHFGHQAKRWHPAMEPYIYTVKKGIHIIDLETTEDLLKKACDFLYETAKKGGKVLFVGTKKQSRQIVEIEAKRSGALYIIERWLGGTFTNFEIIKKNNIDKLMELKKKMSTGEFDHYTKKERLLIDKEIERLEKFVGGLTSMNRVPEAIFVIDAKREKTAIREAVIKKIPIVSLLDTNTNPKNITYPIPGNDDAIRSIALIVKALADAVEQGYKDYAEKTAEDKARSDAIKEAERKADEKAKEKEAAPKIETSMSNAPQKVTDGAVENPKVEEMQEEVIEVAEDKKEAKKEDNKEEKTTEKKDAEKAKEEKPIKSAKSDKVTKPTKPAKETKTAKPEKKKTTTKKSEKPKKVTKKGAKK